MSHFVVCSFERGRSGSPYSFVAKHPLPNGPYVNLNTKRTLDHKAPSGSQFYLVAIQDWTSADQRVQYALRLWESMFDIRIKLTEALKGAEWERDPKTYRYQLVGQAVKVHPYGYFEAEYDNGNRSNGMDVSPTIWFKPARDPSNVFFEALMAGREHLFCLDHGEIERVHKMGRATANLGELLREKHGS